MSSRFPPEIPTKSINAVTWGVIACVAVVMAVLIAVGLAHFIAKAMS